MTRELEHVAMADQVGSNISARVLEAVADARLCAEVDDAVDLDRVGEALERLGVGEVDLLEPEAIAELLLHSRQPRLLERRIIIFVEIVDADDLVAPLEQGARRRRADEPRSPRDQYSHGRPIGGAVRSAKALEASPWSAAGPSPSTAAGRSLTSSPARRTGTCASRSCCPRTPVSMTTPRSRRSGAFWQTRAARSPKCGWARPSPPTPCSSARASAWRWRSPAASATRCGSDTRRGPISSRGISCCRRCCTSRWERSTSAS